MSKKETKRKQPNFPLQPEHRVVFAFSAGGKDWYKFDDTMSIPCGRSFQALSYYEELNMRCTREYLQGTVTAQKNIIKELYGICRSREANLVDIFKKVEELETFSNNTLERLDYIVDTDAVMNLASVIYFDETENPYSYDFKYGREKVALWKKENVADFFLSQPIQSLIPQINLSSIDFAAYLKTLKMMTESQIREILSHLSESDQNKDFYSILKSQITTT